MTGTPTGNRAEARFGATRREAAGSTGNELRNASGDSTRRPRATHILYWLIQWTWGILQNVAGLILMVVLRLRGPRRRLFSFHGAVVVPWGRAGGSMALGMFIFFGHRGHEDAAAVLVHEYGHTIQSCILGPAYLFVIGLPSLIWAWLPVFRRRREDGRANYFDFYAERWANHAGTRVTHRPAPKR